MLTAIMPAARRVVARRRTVLQADRCLRSQRSLRIRRPDLHFGIKYRIDTHQPLRRSHCARPPGRGARDPANLALLAALEMERCRFGVQTTRQYALPKSPKLSRQHDAITRASDGPPLVLSVLHPRGWKEASRLTRHRPLRFSRIELVGTAAREMLAGTAPVWICKQSAGGG
jgi:hypothetical protein